MKNVLGIAAAILAVSVTGTAHAQSATPWYVGGSLGTAKSNVNAGEVNDYLRSIGAGSPSTTADDKDTAYRFLLGYRFSPAVAVEGFYADLGEYNTRSNVLSPFVGTVNADYKAKGYGIDLVLSAPITQEFSVFGRVGIIQAKTEARFNSSGSIGLLFNRGSKNKTGQHFGVGLQYDINPAIALRGEVETYRKLGDDSTGGELKADVLSVGAIFRF
ncbi:MAG: outer membrane beta-barrel protein [Burkholderiales bacterium]|nr:outer membrane beta-barrel protein [Burkholderiales bacterium]